eukprot:155471-Chlamydomonas_euryale.AAC.3
MCVASLHPIGAACPARFATKENFDVGLTAAAWPSPPMPPPPSRPSDLGSVLLPHHPSPSTLINASTAIAASSAVRDAIAAQPGRPLPTRPAHGAKHAAGGGGTARCRKPVHLRPVSAGQLMQDAPRVLRCDRAERPSSRAPRPPAPVRDANARSARAVFQVC